MSKPIIAPNYIDVVGTNGLDGIYTIASWRNILKSHIISGSYTVRGIWGDYRNPTYRGEARIRLGQQAVG